jgi:hypothetical protein
MQMQGAGSRKGRAQKNKELFRKLRAKLLMRGLRTLIPSQAHQSKSGQP